MIAEEERAGAAAEGENYFVVAIEMMAGVSFIFILALVTFTLDFRLAADAEEDASKGAQEVAVELNALQSEAQETKHALLSSIGEEPRRGFQDLEEGQRGAAESAGLPKPRSQRRVRGPICGPLFGDRLLGLLRWTLARVHWQGRSAQASRVRRQGEPRHDCRALERRPVHPPRQGAPRQSV